MKAAMGGLSTCADSKLLESLLSVTSCSVLIRVHLRKFVAQSYEPIEL